MKIYFENEEEKQEFLEAISDSELCPTLDEQETCGYDCRNCWARALEEMSEVKNHYEKQDKQQDQENELKQEVISRFDNEFAFLSNTYNADILYQGLTYKNAESAYQAQKTKCENLRKVFTETSPYEAKELGKQLVLRNDWDQVSVMKSVVYEKFYQNPEIRILLLNTKDAILAPEGIGSFWGVKDGKGKNLLGMILMNVRDELRSEKKNSHEEKEDFDFLLEEATQFVKNTLQTEIGDSLLYLGNIYYNLMDYNLSESEQKLLTKKIYLINNYSSIPLLTSERIDAIRFMLEFGISEEMVSDVINLSKELAKEFLLTCDMNTFTKLVDHVAVASREYYAPENGDADSDDIENINNAIKAILNLQKNCSDLKNLDYVIDSENVDEMISCLKKFAKTLETCDHARVISELSEILENGEDIPEALHNLLKYCKNKFYTFKK